MPNVAPDGPLDLVDEAASSLRLQQESKPERIEKLDREILTYQIELESLLTGTQQGPRSIFVHRIRRLPQTFQHRQHDRRSGQLWRRTHFSVRDSQDAWHPSFVCHFGFAALACEYGASS